MIGISVIICTHNPRSDYLERTLSALRGQTLSQDQWELLLIDNASKEPLAGQWNLSWHSQYRHIRENELGLTPARFRGIREASAELLIFVDDDNVLAPEYLANALELTRSHPLVGALGCNIVGEFEVKPEKWAEPMIPYLAIIEVKHEEWALSLSMNVLNHFIPIGAGMVIRKTVAEYYVKMSANDPLRRGLDRKGVSLVSGGDIDMALCASLLGLAVGRFPQLQLTHLIAARRLTRDYLLGLAEASDFTGVVLDFIWNKRLPVHNEEKLCRSEKIFQAYKSFRKRLSGRKKPSFADELHEAKKKGRSRAAQILQSGQNFSLDY